MTEFWSAWVEPAFGLLEIVGILAAVYLTISQFTRTRASSYIERFNGNDVLANRTAVDQWLGEFATSRDRLAELERNPELRTHLRQFANLFQELGAAYQFGVAHRKTVRVLFDALVVMYWERLRFWVEDYRAHADPTLYARFEYLYKEIKKHETAGTVEQEFALAYGSLMSPVSLGAGLGREVTHDELIPVTLVGYERSWDVGETVVLGDSTEKRMAAFLNVRMNPEESAEAVMVRVTSSELRRLRAREKNYRCEDVRSAVRLTGDRNVDGRGHVWCFIGKREHHVETGDPDVVILSEYLTKVTDAAASLSSTLGADIALSAEAARFPMVDGPYRFTDAEQADLV